MPHCEVAQTESPITMEILSNCAGERNSTGVGKAHSADANRRGAAQLVIRDGENETSSDPGQQNETPEEGLARRAAEDPGVAFEDDCLRLLAKLRDAAPAKYERTIARLKCAGVRISKLEAMLEPDDAGAGDGKDVPDALSRPSQAHQILHVIEPDAELFHTQEKHGYMRVRVNGRIQTLRIEGSEAFKVIRRLFYEQTGQIAQQDSIKSAQSIMDQHGQDAPERKVYLRVASYGGCIYVDLGDDSQTVVRISAAGWEIMSAEAAPVIFIRRSGMRPLPMPTVGGKIDALSAFLNLAGMNERRLFIAALTYAFNSRGPYPLVALHGEHGAAKSTQAIIFRLLLDPSVSALRSMPKTEDDLFVQASNAWLQVYDNVSRISGETSDALCRLLTGGGIGKRALYTDLDQVLVDIMRPGIVTSIPAVAERPDLADRSVMLGCVPILPAKRRAESMFWSDFSAKHAEIFGAVLDIVSCGLRELPSVSHTGLFRMADFHRWGRAVESMNGGAGTFDAAYRANRNNSVVVAIETDPVAAGIVKLMQGKSNDGDGFRRWSGTASDLRSYIIADAGSEAKLGMQPGFPKNAKALSQHLTRISPLLREVDITWRRDKKSDSRDLVISAPKDGKFASLASFVSDEAEHANGTSGLGSEQDDASSSPIDASSPDLDARPPYPDATDASDASFGGSEDDDFPEQLATHGGTL